MISVTDVLRLASYAWAAPCSAVGLLAAFSALLMGVRVDRIDGALEVAVPGISAIAFRSSLLLRPGKRATVQR